MTSMIEKVAGALAKLDTTDEGGHHQLCITSYADIARTAIAAMREPSGAMIDASYRQGCINPTLFWQTMIDAALKEET